MAKRALPEGFTDDEPLQVEVMEDGYSLAIPYYEEGVEGVKYRKLSCMTVKQLCSTMEHVITTIEERRK